VNVRQADAFQDLLERARRAKAAREAAAAELAAVESDIEELARRGGLTKEQESAVAELLAEEHAQPHQHRRRWKPPPS
jgi:hypothetical protein